MILALTSMMASPQPAAGEGIPRFGIFEISLEHAGTYGNPYTDVMATATFERPDGAATRPLSLFWDGGTTWRLRFSPDVVGAWKWRVTSSDDGLNDQSGSFRCVPSDNRGSVISMPGHPLHFAYQDGTPLWWFGDTAWGLYTNNEEEEHDRAAVEHYLDVRAAQGFNVIHSMLISEVDWGNEGGMPFKDLGQERINPAYWREVDARLASLTGRGIVAGLVLAWTDKGRSKQSWQHFPSEDARLRYARYVVARYSAYPVYFVVAGEWDITQDDDSARRTYEAIGREIQRHDPHNRMRAIHSIGQHAPDRLKPFGDSEWVSFGDYQQCYLDMHEAILGCRDLGKPVVNAEYAYYRREAPDGTLNKPNSASVDITRAATWDIAMAGGYFIAGFGSTYFGGTRTRGPFDVDAPKNDDWEAQVQLVRDFFVEREWWRLEPHDELLAGPVAREEAPRDLRGGDIRPASVVYWALSEIGREYIAYIRGHRGDFRLSLGMTPGPAEVSVRRLDPRTGEYAEVTADCTGGVVLLNTPDDQDWVFEVLVGK